MHDVIRSGEIQRSPAGTLTFEGESHGSGVSFFLVHNEPGAGPDLHKHPYSETWIVTPDEIPDPHDLAMELRVNGDVRQTSHSGRMSVTIPEIIAHYSALGYAAGDVLSTGTVSGVAGFSEDAASLYLKPGDVMEAEIERIGVLRNPVVAWAEAHPA